MFPSDPPVQPKRANATLRSTVLLLVPLKVFLFTSSPCHECFFIRYTCFFQYNRQRVSGMAAILCRGHNYLLDVEPSRNSAGLLRFNPLWDKSSETERLNGLRFWN
ncbi:hypothetical protein CI102_5061 [Trichoderma harzianum]|nr:hypothetical protein CI102_5061 [Trichoderma harzianum]